jgi:hypothetical protein
MVIQAGMGENEEPVSKTAKGKGAGDVDQAVEHLPSRHKALSSNLCTAQGKKKDSILEHATTLLD